MDVAETEPSDSSFRCRSSVVLFSLKHIGIAAWMGLGYGGAFLVAANEWRLGRRKTLVLPFLAILAADFLVLIVIGPFLAHFGGTGTGRYRFVTILANIGAAVFVARLLHGSELKQFVGRIPLPRPPRFWPAMVAAIVLGLACGLAFWVGGTMLLLQSS